MSKVQAQVRSLPIRVRKHEHLGLLVDLAQGLDVLVSQTKVDGRHGEVPMLLLKVLDDLPNVIQ